MNWTQLGGSLVAVLVLAGIARLHERVPERQ